MEMITAKKFQTVKEYFSSYSGKQRELLQELRETIKQAAPQAEELISYNMPAFKLNGMLVYYAAYKNHIGLYPMPGAIKFFSEDLSAYKTSKGAIQFPIEKGIPKTLVKKIVKYRVNENLQKAKAKNTKRG